MMSDLSQVLAARAWPENANMYYPCAGQDWRAVVELLGQYFVEMKFCDLRYQMSDLPIAPKGWDVRYSTLQTQGVLRACVQTEWRGKQRIRHVDAGAARFDLQRSAGGRCIQIQLRRGFGQYGLHEIPDGSLDLFLHRGDSSGEGGSNVHFFGNRQTSHPPLANLFDVIKRKLRYPAVLASDGSNVSIPALRDALRGGGAMSFSACGLAWRYLGGDDRLRQTHFWEVELMGSQRA